VPKKEELQDDTPFLHDGLGEQTPAAPPEEGTPAAAGDETPVPHTLSREAQPSVPGIDEQLDLPTPRLPAGMETPMHELGAETPNMPPPLKKARVQEGRT